MQGSLMIYFVYWDKGICNANQKGRINVGVLCQPVYEKTKVNADLPVPSMRMALLFYEFLGRHTAWKRAKQHETIWLLIILLLGLIALFSPWFFPERGFILSISALGVFYYAFHKYLEYNERVNHLYVNVHILHHHLIGKLDVGFCDHTEHCYCAENFRRYVQDKYRISLYNGATV